jgi:CheY-like chemotaxis protein
MSPLFYFKTAALMLDDDALFLNSFSGWLTETVPVKTYTDSKKALEKAQSEQAILEQYFDHSHFVAQSDDGDPAIDFAALQNAFDQCRQLALTSVLFVDYAMPDLDGLAFCEKLGETYARKILLTGHADDTTAVKAFNSGLINQFVVKDIASAEASVLSLLADQQLHFFKALSTYISRFVTRLSETAINEKSYQTELQKVIEKHQPTAYCLTDQYGSYVLHLPDDRVCHFVVRPEAEFENYLNILENQDSYDQAVFDAIATRACLPVLLNDNAVSAPVANWSSYLCGFSKMSDTPFYVAVVFDS